MEPIFPIPTLHSQLTRDFTEKEIEFFNELGKKTVKNQGNSTSHNNYVLDEPQLADLKSEIMEFVTYWFENVAANKSVEPYITQSWVNWTKKDQHHHKHSHANSYLSGVLYINGEDDRINFEKNQYEQIKIIPESGESFNEYNSDVTWFKVSRGKLILFPSYVMHSVDTKKDDIMRVSLAFNVFVRGTVGKTSALTELKL